MSSLAWPACLAAGLVLAALPTVAEGSPVAPGQPWHARADMEKALAEAAFQGLARTHPGVAVAYGAYSVVETGRKATEKRVEDRNKELRQDLLVIDEEAARLHLLVNEGRFHEPEARALVARMKQRAKTLPGGTARFIATALADRRTLYVLARNKAEGKIFKGVGRRVAGWLGVRQATPVLRVSLKGVKGPFLRAQWKSIRHIARRFDHLAQKMAEVMIAALLGRVYNDVVREQIDGAVQDYKRRHPPAPAPGATGPFRLHVIEAAPFYAPVAAVAAQPVLEPPQAAVSVITLQRAMDPVIDYAIVQNQIAHEYAVEVTDAPPTQQTHWQDYEDRSSVPDIDLPSGDVNWDGGRF